ncbi:MAG: patatin-like phospholipase family protein [Ferruginibacter sp.]
MRYFCFFLIGIIFCNYTSAQHTGTRPKIGLTLSGGGAKGLAHIGILKAIDSVGLKIDYITGTSMGAIMGALYAIGYSGEQVEKISRKTDLDILLSNQVALRSLTIEEKDEYGKYAIELPYINRKLRLPGGLLDGQELSFKFSELFYPVHNIKDFNKFNIPFKCIASDITTGQAVVLDKGDIVTALKASMAIPTIFAPIEYDGNKLVDGGLTRNFPVRDVKEMGADIVIGSTVTSGLSSKEHLNSSLDILLQLAFFKEAEDYKTELPLCDICVKHPLEKYTMGSFSSAAKLIEVGNKDGQNMYAALKQLSDSLDKIYGPSGFKLNRLPKPDSVLITEYEIRGLQKTTKTFFLHSMDLRMNKRYAEPGISKYVRRVFSTRYYSSINYFLEPKPDGSAKIVFVVKENPSTYAKLGVQYNDFAGISVIANLTSRDLFARYSRSMATVSIGQNTHLKGEHLQYFGYKKNIAVIAKFQFESYKLNNYSNYIKTGQYRQLNYLGEIRGEYSNNQSTLFGFSTHYERIQFKPLILTSYEVSGKNDFFTSLAFLKVNTLNKSLYPTRGVKINAEFGLVYNQDPKVKFVANGVPITNLDSLGISYDNYQKMFVSAEEYIPLSSKFTFYTMFQSGINFNYKQNLVNNFQIGGLTKTIRNQIVFAGLVETTISSPSVASLMIGLNYKVSKNIYIMAKTNALVNNFISRDHQIKFDNWISGHALTFAYNTPIGPLEISAMYSDQSGKVSTYVNFGVPF